MNNTMLSSRSLEQAAEAAFALKQSLDNPTPTALLNLQEIVREFGGIVREFGEQVTRLRDIVAAQADNTGFDGHAIRMI